MKKYKMLIFDMDGTILYTLEDLKNTTNYALSEHGFPERTSSCCNKSSVAQADHFLKTLW